MNGGGPVSQQEIKKWGAPRPVSFGGEAGNYRVVVQGSRVGLRYVRRAGSTPPKKGRSQDSRVLESRCCWHRRKRCVPNPDSSFLYTPKALGVLALLAFFFPSAQGAGPASAHLPPELSGFIEKVASAPPSSAFDPRGLIAGGIKRKPYTTKVVIELRAERPVLELFLVRVAGKGVGKRVEVIRRFKRPPAGKTFTVREERLKRGLRYAYVALARGAEGALAGRLLGEVTIPYVFSWHRLKVLLGIVLFAGLYVFFLRRAGKGKVFLRRLAGIDAVEEALGRATEMGRPVLYVPGLEDQTEMQTLASMVILGHVARRSADYGVRLVVPTRSPVVMTMAQEIVRDAFAVAGRPDAYVEDDVRYLSDEQFAFCAGVDGIMLRERPAANLFLGYFYAESLILAETGFASGAMQVAGTAAVAQIPFFIVACDYTMIGEEFYAASAYLSRDPQVVAGIKAADWLKAALIGYFLLGLGGELLLQAGVGGPALGPLIELLKHPERMFLGGP